ncbi:MarR family transcriptional regulator [Kribbella sp. NBC_01245]|uniref:MarR family winged helix-turn-helix transcriptional regulator n=1 Tax=Kribbella sp. NBC_01245 TaxID=2903578 RepID=UPI002E2AEA2F|nr:MarR family transcriptional regulator [Kribbella sp. NBC_01245]
MSEQRAGFRPIGYWLKRVHELIDASFDQLLKEAGVGRRHWQVLNTLAADGPQRLPELEAALKPFLSADEPSLAPVIDDLIKREWVASDDAFALTADGTSAHARLLERVTENRQQLTAGISPEEYQSVVDCLARMAGNLEGTSSSQL